MPRTPLRSNCLSALAVAVVVGNGYAPAQTPGFGSNDAVQLKAKSALESDPALKGLNLLVSVQDGVVLVTGGVPDQAVAAKIEAALTKVPGVSVVRVTTWTAASVDPLPKLVADKLAGLASAPPTDNRLVPGLAVNPVRPGSAPPTVPSLPQGIGAEVRPPGSVVAQRIDPASADGLLQPPVVANQGSTRLPPEIDVPPAPSGPVGYPTIRATRVPVAPAVAMSGDLALTLLAIRRSDSRFAGLVAEVRSGTAVVTGVAASRADADAFAAEVEKVRGIDRVTVGSIQIR